MVRRFVFVDESGDLGFGEGGSQHVTMAAVVTSSPRQLERIPLKIRRRRLKKSLLKMPELKFQNSGPGIRKAILNMVGRLEDVSITSMTVVKTGSPQRRRKCSGEALYLWLAGELLLEVALRGRSGNEFNFIFDARPLGRSLGRSFEERMNSIVVERCGLLRAIPPRIRISRFDSMNSKGLQVADFVAGAVQRKYEHGQTCYFDLISSRVELDRMTPLGP